MLSLHTSIEIVSYCFFFISIYLEVFLLISFLEKKPVQKIFTDDTLLPTVMVIVPCYNERNTIAGTLNSLLAIDYPRAKLSLLVIDDGSTDDTQKSLDPYRGNPQIQIIQKENGGKYTALNLGLSINTSDFVGCLDADSFVDPGSLRDIIAHFADPTVMAVTPSIVIWEPRTFIQKMQRAEYHYGNFMRQALSIIGALYVTPGPFSFFRREVFEKLGGYKHAHNTEDIEIALRMQKHGMKIIHAAHVVVRTSSPRTIRSLYKQRVRWISGFLHNMRDNRDMIFSTRYGDLGMLFLPLTVLGVLASIPFVIVNLYSAGHALWKNLEESSISGIFFHYSFGHFDPFFMDTSTVSLISMFLLGVAIIILAWSTSIIGGKWKWNADILYLLLYTFISPFWLAKSIYNAVFSRQATWR